MWSEENGLESNPTGSLPPCNNNITISQSTLEPVSRKPRNGRPYIRKCKCCFYEKRTVFYWYILYNSILTAGEKQTEKYTVLANSGGDFKYFRPRDRHFRRATAPNIHTYYIESILYSVIDHIISYYSFRRGLREIGMKSFESLYCLCVLMYCFDA